MSNKINIFRPLRWTSLAIACTLLAMGNLAATLAPESISASPPPDTIYRGYTTVLPGDGSFSTDHAPQGALRYQRQLFLITPAEMMANGLDSGMLITSLGFTLGAAQDDTAAGSFKIYLQNTTDSECRMDTNWTTVTTSTNSTVITGLAQGDYEWQVKTVCSGTSDFTALTSFSNAGLSGCNQPYNLSTESITASTAVLQWECSSSPEFLNYKVEYSIWMSGNWQSFTTADTFFTATGLHADTSYQWRVLSQCSAGESPVSAASFQTGTADLCGEPGGLAIGTLTDTTAVISWNPVSGASYYDLGYRRKGTTYWISGISFSNTYMITGLEHGTQYEWKVKTRCASGSGSFVTGNDFITGGPLVCYVPGEPKTSGINDAGATFTWLAVPGAASYQLRYRLKESISWSNAYTPMTQVYDSLLVIPNVAGPYDVVLDTVTPFLYHGKGLYVAWEFVNDSGSLSSPNSALCTRQNSMIYGSNGSDSLAIVLCLNGNSDSLTSALPGILSATSLRPETRIGSPDLRDSVAIVAMYGLGYQALPYGNPLEVKILVQNLTNSEKTYPLNLSVVPIVSGTPGYSIIQNITIPGDTAVMAVFSEWSPLASEIKAITVSIPAQQGENVLDNNIKSFQLVVNPTLLSYADHGAAISGGGLGNDAGLILARHSITGCGKVIAAEIYLHSTAENHAIRAVILDDEGTMLDTSAWLTPGADDINRYNSFYFPSSPLITGTDFYIGLHQSADSLTSYYPIGIQWENPPARDNTWYKAATDGSALSTQSFGGRLMIKAEILPATPDVSIGGNANLCNGDTNLLSVTAKETRFASGVIGFSSQYPNPTLSALMTLGSPDVYPGNTASSGTWIASTADGQRESLVLSFPGEEPISFVDIYETYNPGSVDTVYVKNPAGLFVPVYTGSAVVEPQSSKIKHITFPKTSYNVKEIRLAMNSPAVPGYNAIDAVAIGSIDTPASFSTYLWGPGGETTPTLSVSIAGTYSLTVTTSDGCQATASLVVQSPEAVVPTITSGGPLEFCQGDSVILTASQASGITWNTGQTSQSISAKTTGAYFVSYNNGCESINSGTTQVMVNPLPTVTISGGNICPGVSGSLDAGTGFSSYLWSTEAITQSITTAIPGLYNVTVTDANNCKASASHLMQNSPAPSPSITGNTQFCPGESTLLDAGPSYNSYLWSGGATTQDLTVNAAGTFSVTVTNSYGCTGTASKVTSLYPEPTPFITGTLSLCAGTATFLDAGTAYVSYLWSGGETTHSIVVDTAATFSVTVTNSNGCTGSASATTTTDGMMPATPGPISGQTSGVCNASGLVYSITPLSNTTHYVWSVPAGVTITAGQGTPAITVNVGSLTSGTISVAASNACGQSASWNPSALTIYGTPSAPTAITGQSIGVCGLSAVTYSVVPVPGATSYTWTCPLGATISSGQGTASVTLSFSGTFTTGSICVSAESSCGTSLPICTNVIGRPPSPSAVSGLSQVCIKQKNVVYSVAPVNGATSYTWTVPFQATITNGQGTNSVTVNFWTQSGSVSVIANNSCGSSSPAILPVAVLNCNKDLSGNPGNLNPGGNGSSLSGDGVLEASLKPEVIASAGNFSSGPNASLSWTLGEMIIETAGNDPQFVTQGFQQEAYQVVAINENQEDPAYSLALYPVPATDHIFIDIKSSSEHVSLKIEMYDVTGSLVYEADVESTSFKEKIELAKFPTSMFILKVINLNNNRVQSFRIIKCKI